jgi:replicative DNA helicase
MTASKPLSPMYDETAERALLGAMLLEERAINAASKLSPEDFYLKSHQEILIAIRRLYAQDSGVDYITVCGELAKRKPSIPWGEGHT